MPPTLTACLMLLSSGKGTGTRPSDTPPGHSTGHGLPSADHEPPAPGDATKRVPPGIFPPEGVHHLSAPGAPAPVPAVTTYTPTIPVILSTAATPADFCSTGKESCGSTTAEGGNWDRVSKRRFQVLCQPVCGVRGFCQTDDQFPLVFPQLRACQCPL